MDYQLIVGQVATGAAVGIGVAGIALGVGAGVLIARSLGAKSLANARTQAKETLEKAQAEARTTAEKIRIDAEKELLERRTKAEEELEKSRAEVREVERRLSKREDAFDRKEESLSAKEQALSRQAEQVRQREERIGAREAELDRVYAEQKEQLQRVAGMSSQQAQQVLLQRVEEESRHEVAKVVRKTLEEAETNAKDKAREITLMAIQRYASEHTSESTVRSVAIPSDDMKGRSEVAEQINKHGREAALEVNLRGMHPKVIEAMGKLYYRTSYGQNVLRHSVEVAFLCQIIAEQLGLDGTVARRCGFLHDIGKAMDHEMEGGHPKIGMDFARQYGEKEPVLNAIGGHHADIPSTSFYTPIVMAADAVSSARPGARRESMEKYIQRLNELQDIALSYKGVNEAYAIQAGREVRVMVDAARVGDDEAYLIAHQIAKKVSEEMTFPGEIKVTVLRETRAIEYAR